MSLKKNILKNEECFTVEKNEHLQIVTFCHLSRNAMKRSGSGSPHGRGISPSQAEPVGLARKRRRVVHKGGGESRRKATWKTHETH